ncbi:unnamed protein product [Mytilus edulis]|uniref:Uncharacterized protein n=1 Tax=Mytilus edulis TaxID=6550 RepID=A0A8S3QQD5_MYTED|nr:unnamed protein product [Mytilus edulis]
MKTDSDEMPLVAACQQGHGFLIQMLIDGGADVDEALCCAAHKGYDRTIKILLYKGGTICYKGVNGKSLLSLACEQGSTKTVKFLLEKGADFREIDVNGKTLIHVACSTGSVDLVQILLDKGLNLIIHDKNGRYPLAVSVKKGFYDLSKLLIKQRCPIATSEEDIKTAMMSVFESGNKELSKLLVANGYTANLSHFNETVLYHAYKLGLGAIVEILRRNEPTLRVKYKYGYTPMILADIGGNDDLSEYLQNSICGADVNSIGRFGQTALYAACIGGNYTIVKFLIDQGAFIDTKVRRASILDEPTCLHAAYLSDNHHIVQLLINRGAYVDAVGNFGRTLLHKACSDGNYKTVEILMDKGVDLNASDMHGATPLIMCVLQNIEDNHGENAFIYEMKNYYFLEENSLNQPLGDYFDQLHKECVHEWNKYSPSDFGSIYKRLTDNHYKVIQLLIENGADINKADKKDRTPLSLAKMIGDMKLTDILLQKVLLSIKKDNSHGRNQ